MWRKILSLAQGRHHKYRHMEISSLPSAVINGLTSQIYYTPKVQRMPFTVELARYLRFLQRKETVSVADLRKLTESILTEYGVIHGLENEPKFAEGINYGIERNFYLPLNDLIPYEGEVDWLLSLDKFHFCPVMFF